MKTITILLFLMSFGLCAQESYNLEYFLAKSINSSDYSIINKQAEIYNMEHQLFNKNFLPDFNLNITLPSYNRSIREVLQPDGNYAFRESNNASSRANLSVTQKIPYTGGSVSITNSFSRLDFFGDTQNTTTYAASWLGVNLTQPLNFFNTMKWDKKIQDARVRQNNISYEKEKIEIKKKTIYKYFELFQIKRQKMNLDKEMDIAKKYKEVIISLVKAGKIIDYDAIDIELKILDIQKNLWFITKSQDLKTESINTFFNSKVLKTQDVLETLSLNIKLEKLDYYINGYLEVYNIIEGNGLLSLEKNIRQLEKSRFYSAELSLGVGFNKSAGSPDNIFKDPNQSQNIAMSLSVPLLDFGKKRVELEKNRTQYDLKKISLKQDKNLAIENLAFLYEEINDLIKGLKIEESRITLLETKKKRMEKLLFSQIILLKDYSETEQELDNSINDKINIIRSIYNKAIQIEEITLLKII